MAVAQSDLSEATPQESGRGKTSLCAITGRRLSQSSVVHLSELRPSLAARIRADYPLLTDDAVISRSEVSRYRSLYVEDLLRAEHGELTAVEREVATSLAGQGLLAEDIEREFDQKRSFGDMLADRLSAFGGSWAFLIGFFTVLAAWTGINAYLGPAHAFDAYPFIFLNLILSCLAAVQAPVIMMSQRRAEAKDRARSQSDYQINLKAELEIRHLHEKLDHLISRQWQRLAEIQQVQLDSMHDYSRNHGGRAKTP